MSDLHPIAVTSGAHPCITRCWRVGTPTEVVSGVCVECGRPTPRGRRVLLPHGVSVILETSGHAMPPDHHGMAPASCSLWLRFEGGPSGWWRPVTRSSSHKVVAELEHCEDIIDVVLLCDMWAPSAKR